MTYYAPYETSEGYIGIARVWNPGDSGDPFAFEAPTNWLLSEDNTLSGNPAHIERNVYGFGRDSDHGHRTGKYKVGGAINFAQYPANGHDLLVGALGKEVAVGAIASDTTVSITTSTDGTQSILTLTTGGAWVPGQLAKVDTGAAQELMPVISYVSGTKALTLPVLQNTHSSAGTTVVGPAQNQARTILTSDGVREDLLPFMAVEENIAGAYSWQYRAGLVGKYDLKGAATKLSLSTEIFCQKQRQLANGTGGNPSPTPIDLSDTTLQDLSLEFTDGFMVFPTDQTASGTTTVGYVELGQDWELSIDNALKEEPCFDGTNMIKVFPGSPRKVTGKFKFMETSNRPVAYTDFLTQNLNVPFFIFLRYNKGTALSPKWQALCYYMPNFRYIGAPEDRKLGQRLKEDVDGIAIKVGSTPKISVFSINES